MNNRELCEAVRGLPEDAELESNMRSSDDTGWPIFDAFDFKRLVNDYERLLAAAKGVREVGIISRYGKDLIAAIKECEE